MNNNSYGAELINPSPSYGAQKTEFDNRILNQEIIKPITSNENIVKRRVIRGVLSDGSSQNK